mmetsp:Transcript_76396/g.93832  ORF Transcript_76396/g.93832 Transcript_76396/m.93832 type:complete len:133 (-) Transcript_76396:55-453(-)
MNYVDMEGNLHEFEYLKLENENESKPFICKCTINNNNEYCNSRFKHKCHLKRHAKEKHVFADRFKYKCTFCNQVYKQASSLKQHIQVTHTNNRHRFKCDYCDENYTRWSSLKRHHQKHHPSLPPPNKKKFNL